MTTLDRSDRFELELPERLERVYLTPLTGYRDELLARTAHTRQRPAWTFLERWLPMSSITQRLVLAPRVPWRALAAVALLLLALVIGALILAAGQPRVPAPFGVAANGLIAFTNRAGAVLLGDPVAGTSRTIVPTGSNSRVRFSPDGTRIAYLQLEAATGLFDIVVARWDGANPLVVTASPLEKVGYLDWTPDSRSVVVTVPQGRLVRFDADREGSPHVIVGSLSMHGDPTGMGGFNSQVSGVFRPPSGEQIVFLGSTDTTPSIFLADADGSNRRVIFDSATSPLPSISIDSVSWSPDGSRIVFVAGSLLEPDRTHVFVIDADGSHVRQLTSGADSTENNPQWSPDGRFIAVQRWLDSENPDDPPNVRPVTLVPAGGGLLDEVGVVNLNGYVSWAWSPDGKSILYVPQDDTGRIVVVDVATDKVTEQQWTSASQLSWQRTAP